MKMDFAIPTTMLIWESFLPLEEQRTSHLNLYVELYMLTVKGKRDAVGKRLRWTAGEKVVRIQIGIKTVDSRSKR